MSYSFVIIDLKNECNIKEIDHYIASNYKDYEILYCNTNNVKSWQDVSCYNFNENAKPEEVINAVIQNTKKENIVLIRKFTNVELLKQLTSNIKDSNSIVYFKQKRSGFVKFIDKCFSKLFKFVFGKTIQDTNYFASAYGKTISNVLRNVNCTSNSSRMNNWTGVNEVCLESDVKYKIEYKKTRMVYSLVSLFVTVFAIALWHLLKSKLGMWYNLFTLFIVLLGFIFFFVFTSVWYYRSKIGENITEKAKYKLN